MKKKSKNKPESKWAFITETNEIFKRLDKMKDAPEYNIETFSIDSDEGRAEVRFAEGSEKYSLRIVLPEKLKSDLQKEIGKQFFKSLKQKSKIIKFSAKERIRWKF